MIWCAYFRTSLCCQGTSFLSDCYAQPDQDQPLDRLYRRALSQSTELFHLGGETDSLRAELRRRPAGQWGAPPGMLTRQLDRIALG